MDTTASLPIRRVQLPQALLALLALASVLGVLAAGYARTLQPVTLVIDGRSQRLRTHQDTLSALLMDRGVVLREADHVLCNGADVTGRMDVALEPGATVTILSAHPVYVTADGQTALFRTLSTSIQGVLLDAQVSVGPYDEVEVVGNLAANPEAEPAHVVVHRAVPMQVQDRGETKLLYTTAATVGEALRRAGLTLYLADGVEPGLGERVARGMSVVIDRSTPVTVQCDGRVYRTRTHREYVGEVLADLGLILTGKDYTTPTLESSLGEGATIHIVRVTDRFLVEQEPIPFESTWEPDPDLEIDNWRVKQEGAPGALLRRIRVRYEDGQEVERAVEDEYIAVPPATKIFGYGTQIIVRTVDTPSGPVEYWRVFRMLATSYSPSTAGTSPDRPWYGRTRTGMKAGFGIVAIDPRWIDLRTKVYVPGYGVAVAGDTGGKIKGKRVDLGYDDDNLVMWYRWVDVYLLTPVPSAIDYSLNLPQ